MIDPIVSGSIIYGCSIALMCLGLTMTYMTTKVPNFAHGDFVATGVYTTAISYLLWNLSTPYFAFPLAMLTGGLFALIMYLLVIRPLTRRNSSLVVLMIATLGVDIVFTGILSILVQYLQSTQSRYIQGKGYYLTYLSSLPDIRVLDNQLLLFVAPALLIAVTTLMYLMLNRTKFGIAMRAAIENPSLAKILGINTEIVYLVSWFLAGAIAGISGAVYSVAFAAPENIGSLIIVEIFAGSILGGLSSLYGSIVAGFIVGASEIYLTSQISNIVSRIYGAAVGSQILNFQRGIPLAIMIVALLFTPQGLAAVSWKKVFIRKRSLE